MFLIRSLLNPSKFKAVFKLIGWKDLANKLEQYKLIFSSTSWLNCVSVAG